MCPLSISYVVKFADDMSAFGFQFSARLLISQPGMFLSCKNFRSVKENYSYVDN